MLSILSRFRHVTFSSAISILGETAETIWCRVNMQPHSQGLSSLPPLVVGIKILVAAGHVITCDTNFSRGVESTNNFSRSQPGEAK